MVRVSTLPAPPLVTGAVDGYNGRALLEPVQIIRPGLHHPAALGQVCGTVVGAAHGIGFHVSKLALDARHR